MQQWCQLLKEEGGAVLAVVLREWDWPRRAGLSEAVDGLIGYLERNWPRMEYPEYLAHGWCIGSGGVEKACKTVVGQRLKLAGMRWGEDEVYQVCHFRALYRSEKGQLGGFLEPRILPQLIPPVPTNYSGLPWCRTQSGMLEPAKDVLGCHTPKRLAQGITAPSSSSSPRLDGDLA